jgi:hypothetical protein
MNRIALVAALAAFASTAALAQSVTTPFILAANDDAASGQPSVSVEDLFQLPKPVSGTQEIVLGQPADLPPGVDPIVTGGPSPKK